MNTNAIYIPIHSFSDLITNSSSETYIQASDSSIKQAKEIVNSLLKVGGSTQSADDLFEFDLVYLLSDIDKNLENKAKSTGIEIPEKSWYDVYATKNQIDAFINSLTEDESNLFTAPWDSYDVGYNVNLRITPKDSANEETNKIAKLLSGFVNSFDVSSQYNG